MRFVKASKEVEGRQFVGPTKNRLNRSATMPAFLADALTAHIAKFVNTADREALVFSSAEGSYLRQTAFRNRVFKPAAKRAGLPPKIRPHDLRHTAVALAVEAGWHPKKIQEMLGHSSIEVTLGTYGHLFESLHGEGAERLDLIYREAERGSSGEVVSLPAPRQS